MAKTKFVCEKYLADSSLGAFEGHADHRLGPGCRIIEVDPIVVVEPGKTNLLRGHVELFREKPRPKDALGRLALIIGKLAPDPVRTELQECADDLAALFRDIERSHNKLHDDHMALVGTIEKRMRRDKRRKGS